MKAFPIKILKIDFSGDKISCNMLDIKEVKLDKLEVDQMIKAAFFDVDGTIYSHKSKGIPQSTLKAMDLLKQRGIKTFLATGRDFTAIDRFPVGKIRFNGYVMLNGQLCTDQDRNIILSSPIDAADASYLLDAFRKKTRPVALAEKDRLYINMIDEAVIRAQAGISSELPQIMKYEGAPVYQFMCYGGKELEEEFSEKLPHCKVTRWSPYGVDVISKNGGKMTGIQKMLEVYGISKEETIAFGDGENDIEMLKFAQVGVAMGNAETEVQKAADYVTEDIDADGIWNALKHFHII